MADPQVGSGDDTVQNVNADDNSSPANQVIH